MKDLHGLLGPEEFVWLTGIEQLDLAAAGLTLQKTLDCLQMVLPEDVVLSEPRADVVQLTCSDAAEMVTLTDVAFPGFFRSRTCEMGRYFGIRSGGDLIAMGGERFRFSGYSEISGLCTHPRHRGKGYAAALIWEVFRRSRSEGIVSWLHVSTVNQRAIDLYLALGFQTVRTITLFQIARK